MILIAVSAGTLTAIAVFLSWCLWCDHRSLEQSPSISDDEFMALCKPGTDRRIALGVRRIVAEQLGVDYYHIRPDTRFVEDLGCD